ncbi:MULTISPECIES: hypothetical protein [unclassified Moraxella]|uniref:hypothetical protein n=1 Tax=unclassified Moraxella TaxID=2685852 RepID=UPI002B400988|nr:MULTISPECIES: hypothetical protein [unclassified Moraxella]
MNDHTSTLIARTTETLHLANISVYLGMVAIICFSVFGTLASMANFKDNAMIYYAFHYLPYALIGVSIPISLFHLFFLWRYQIMQGAILVLIFLTAMSLTLFALGNYAFYGKTTTFFMAIFLAMVAWFAMPYVFRVNLRKFLNFLEDKSSQSNNPENT